VFDIIIYFLRRWERHAVSRGGTGSVQKEKGKVTVAEDTANVLGLATVASCTRPCSPLEKRAA